MQEINNWKNGKRHGYWEDYYFGIEAISNKGTYDNGIMNGEWTWYQIDGSLWLTGHYVNGEKSGFWIDKINNKTKFYAR